MHCMFILVSVSTTSCLLLSRNSLKNCLCYRFGIVAFAVVAFLYDPTRCRLFVVFARFSNLVCILSFLFPCASGQKLKG